MDIRVECHAGHRAEEEPRVFHLGPRRIAIAAIADRWLDPRHRYFKVLGEDGATYLLRHDEASGAWDLTWFEAGGRG